MFHTIGWVCIALIALTVMRAASARGADGGVFRVEAYGAKADSDSDSGPSIRKAIAAAIASGRPAKVVLGPGVYRIAAEPDSGHCLPIDGAEGLTVQGVKGKTELVVTDPTVGCFRLTRCRDTWLKGLTIDYDPLPFTQGRITAVDVDAGTFDLDIQPGFPLLSEPWFSKAKKRWGMPIHPTKRQPKAGYVDHIFMDSWKHLGGRKFRMVAEKGKNWRVKAVAVGDRWVQLARIVGGGGVGIFQCKNSGCEDVTVMASPSVAGAIVRSEGIVMRRFSVRFRPGTKRLLSTNADGIHCPANRSGPLIEECLFEGMADDSVNVYVRPNVVLEVTSPRQIAVSPNVVILPGDRVQIIDPRTGRLKGEAKVIDSKFRNRRIHLTLDKAIPALKAGTDHRNADTLFNLDASGEGYVIRNCIMRWHRRHGLLLRAGKGLIEGNRFEHLGGLGIVVTNEPGWPEGPLARDIIIRNNTLVGCGRVNYGPRADGGMIQVRGAKLNYALAEGHAHRRITIEGNTIIDPKRVGIYVGSAEDVRIVGNTVKASADTPSQGDEDGWAVVLENCGKVRIDKLTVTDPRPAAKAAVLIMKSVDPGPDGVTITGLKAKLGPNGRDVIDERSQPKAPAPKK